MDTVIVGLAKEWGGIGFAFVVAVFILLDKSGLIKRWSASRTSEREQLSGDIQEFIGNLRTDVANLRTDVENQRRWRAEDKEECDKKLDAMEERLDTVLKDTAKWRHLAGNLAMHINKDRIAMRAAGIEAPRFAGWDRFLADGGDPSEFDFDP